MSDSQPHKVSETSQQFGPGRTFTDAALERLGIDALVEQDLTARREIRAHHVGIELRMKLHAPCRRADRKSVVWIESVFAESPRSRRQLRDGFEVSRLRAKRIRKAAEQRIVGRLVMSGAKMDGLVDGAMFSPACGLAGLTEGHAETVARTVVQLAGELMADG